MVIVETTVWIDYLGGTTNPHISWLNRELTRQRLGLTELILCEVLQGIRDDRVYTEVHHDLLRLQVFSTSGIELAVASAYKYRFLRKRGITVCKIIDCLMATFCLDSGHWLLHRDQDYDPFEARLGLQVISSMSFPILGTARLRVHGSLGMKIPTASYRPYSCQLT